MKTHKKILLLLIALSIISIVVGYIMLQSVKIGLCPSPPMDFYANDVPCAYKLATWSESLFMISIFCLPTLIIMFFLSKRFFDAWKWFACIFGIISILLIIWAPRQGGGLMPITKEVILIYTSTIFSVISLIIILFQTYYYFRDKRKNIVK